VNFSNGIATALKNSFLTDKKFWPKKTVAELNPIVAKYL
jgi:hypothetical protein